MKSFLRSLLLVAALSPLAACSAFNGQNANIPSSSDFEPGETITVKGNENIYTIARAHNVSMRGIIALNNLQPPFSVRPGQSLTLPENTSGAAYVKGAAPAPEAAPLGVIEQQPLQPIQSAPISSAPVSSGTQKGANQSASPFSTGSSSYAGSQPVTSAPVEDLNQPSPQPKAIATTASQNVSNNLQTAQNNIQNGANVSTNNIVGGNAAPAAVPPAVISGKPTIANAAATAAATAPANEAEAPASSFSAVWPVQGPIISNYGPKGQGLNNDGINIGAPKGAPVVAAAGGTVVYAGNEMKGFGNLILIRHPGGWVTAYAHLERMLVTRDTPVAQGDMIGTVGKTGDVSAPQLHFETRQGGKPVDPNSVIQSN